MCALDTKAMGSCQAVLLDPRSTMMLHPLFVLSASAALKFLASRQMGTDHEQPKEKAANGPN
jgi:hypothetical protein